MANRIRTLSVSTLEDRIAEREAQLQVLTNHHSQCELNYHRCMSLLTNCRESETQWLFRQPGESRVEVRVHLQESAPYTSTFEFFPDVAAIQYVSSSCIKVRLYHDVSMAEVVGWDRHRRWQGAYEYPNRAMYQRDEKLLLNRFLSELLIYCSKLGYACKDQCESIRISKK